MSLKEYIPAIKYGNKLGSGEIDAGAIATADIADDAVSVAKLADGVPLTVVANTNGTTAVSVFGASGLPYAITITGVFLVSQDTTAGNITVENPASTVVCTIAKGTTAGALVGATTLANTSVAAGTDVVVDSSSAGNARVHISYVKA